MRPTKEQLGVFTKKRAGGSRRINDRIFSGPRGAVQRYNAGENTEVAQRMYGSSYG